MKKLIPIIIFFCIGGLEIYSQEIYYNRSTLSFSVEKLNIENCVQDPVHDFRNMAVDPEISIFDMTFHPDGHLYLTTQYRLIRYNVSTGEVTGTISIRDLIIDDVVDNYFLAASEEGRFVISGGYNGIYDYDLRNEKLILRYEGTGIISGGQAITGIIGDDFFAATGIEDNEMDESYGIWDPVLSEVKSLTVFDKGNYLYFVPALDLPECQTLQLINFRATPGEERLEFFQPVRVDVGSGTIEEICPELSYPNTLFGIATPTDFRQSPLRIDLDADNSSGHITAGYYDTLTTCMKEVPLMAEDIEISTCGAEVDKISFRLKYYDQPLLPEEEIFSEGFESQLRQTSASRWEWTNPFGVDEDRIKAFLRSLRYRADWDPSDPEESRERVVAVTMHVGEDSTSSWAVYQLNQSEVYAGRDTLVEYCTEQPFIDLHNYLTPGVVTTGRFDAELSDGDSRFIPGTDEDSEYLYIVQEGDCADTAVLTVQSAVTEVMALDTVALCPGGRRKIGFPSGKYSEIEWWDGSSGDSIWVEEMEEIQRRVEVQFGDCRISVPVEIIISPVSSLAGPDTVITYCPSGPEIDLNALLPAPEGSIRWLEPGLESGGSTFIPGTDAEGEYRYIVRIGDQESGCTDTSTVTLEETGTQELPFEPVTVCSEDVVRLGLPVGEYADIIWWNGETGDSVTLYPGNVGPYWVEAERDGCLYRGDIDVERMDSVAFPTSYPDTLRICGGEERMLPVTGLDSVITEGIIYRPGDEISFFEPGEYRLSGYQSGCRGVKFITVLTIPDPSEEYSETIPWCEGNDLVLTLPEDEAGITFSWPDGNPGRDLTVEAVGDYPFMIRGGDCEYEGYYRVESGDDCPECTVSIPNAVTPNGDWINDGLDIFLSGCGALESVTLIDKWGGVLYSTANTTVEAHIWSNLPPGVYIVQVVYEDDRGRMKSKAGSVLVIR